MKEQLQVGHDRLDRIVRPLGLHQSFWKFDGRPCCLLFACRLVNCKDSNLGHCSWFALPQLASSNVGCRCGFCLLFLQGMSLCVAAFIFFNFLLSIAATVFATKAIEEIKVKQREEYNRLSVLSDTLQYEVDQ